MQHWFLYLPYLPLEDRLEIGDRQLIPAADLTEPPGCVAVATSDGSRTMVSAT